MWQISSAVSHLGVAVFGERGLIVKCFELYAEMMRVLRPVGAGSNPSLRSNK